MNERLKSIRHGNLRKPNSPRPGELKELLALGPLRKINRILRKNDKSKLSNGEQNLKLAARHHNFTPIEKRRLARRLRSKDSSLKATQLREEAKMPYYKAKKVSISINSAEANARQRIIALRRILFINPKVETLKTTFMGNIFTKDGQAIKQLARFITGASAKDMEVFFYGQTGHGLTNRDVHLLIHQGLREIPIARISSSSGKVFLEITCSYPSWSAAHLGSLSNLDGSWTDGQINFYHRQKKLERKQVEQIFNRWLG
ncbi:hypothetical protein HZA75_02085 [Candidatus Roizmanbacteria bacterium]|nr:hypothetical protein [Candidatus Roizmanbacteria bacterium]